jgi:mevalonate kinase
MTTVPTSTATASGKVILVGEHAVVYGMPAIAVGIDRGVTASARVGRSAEASELRVTLAEGEPIGVRCGDGSELGRAFTALIESVAKTRDVGHLDIDVATTLPAGVGLGCSAALGVAIARAACGTCGSVSDDEAREHAMAWERVFHGNPSGVDAAVAALGGTLLFVRDGERSVVQPIVARSPLVLVIGHSGLVSSTRMMVESVARQRAQCPAVVDKTFDAIGAIVRNAHLAIEAGDLRAVGKLLDMNQMLLAGLLLSTREIESMCAAARREGALGVKLTGAGGGGCVVALAETHANAEQVLAAWTADGKAAFITEVSGPPTAHTHGERSEVQP